MPKASDNDIKISVDMKHDDTSKNANQKVIASDDLDNSKHSYLDHVYSKEELDKILMIGVFPEEIIKLLGKPYNSQRFGDNQEIIIYVFKEKDSKGGFIINFKDGKLVGWGMKPFHTVDNIQEVPMPSSIDKK